MKNIAPKNVDISSGGFTSPYSVKVASDTEVFTFFGSKTLSGNMIIQGDGTPANHCTVTMLFTNATPFSSPDYGVSIFGVPIPRDVTSGPFYAVAYYTHSAWTVWYGPLGMPTIKTGGGLGVDGTTGGLIIAPLSVTNAMIAVGAAIAYAKLDLAGQIKNSDVNASAAIAYAKLNLAASIVNADVAAGAGIVYSKLELTDSITNDDIATGAGIVYSKLVLTGSIVNADISGSAAIAYSKLNLASSIVNADIAVGAAISFSKMAGLTASRILGSDGSGVVSALDTGTYPSLTELTYLKGVTSSIQTQLNAKVTDAQSFSQINGTTVLTAANIKKALLLDTSGGGYTVTLPAASTMTDLYPVQASCVGHVSNVAVLAADGADKIVDETGAEVSSVSMAGYGKAYTLILDKGSSRWRVVLKIA